MSSGAAPEFRLSAAEYLVWEREQPVRHEFLDGEVFAMAGGSPRHNALVAAVTIELGVALRGGACRVLSSDQRIVARDGEHYVYADASVVCGRMELAVGTTDVLVNPSLVVEVLSKRTEAYDRGLKWGGYQRIPSLTDYVLVSQARARVEHFVREPIQEPHEPRGRRSPQEPREWRYRIFEGGERITLANGVSLAVDALYAGVLVLEGE